MDTRELAQRIRRPSVDNSTLDASLTLAVVAPRRGDLADVVKQDHEALAIDRRSQPSLLMVGSELDHVLRDRYLNEPDTHDFHELLIAVTHSEGLAPCPSI